jgi:transketolase
MISENLAKKIRLASLKMVHKAKASHIGSCFSMADLLAVLYGKVMRINPSYPEWKDRDRFILSKGHAASILYAVLAEQGFFSKEVLDDYCQDKSQLTGHVNHDLPGVEVSTGSLGHGLPIGCGIALSGKREHQPYRVFVLLSDGELDEGSNWEAILFGAHHKLDNLVIVIDYNKIQSFGTVQDVLELEPLASKFQSFRWSVKEIDGHDCGQIENVLESVPFEEGKPSCIIAHTVKGKGVSFMENQLSWHYKSPNDEQLNEAIAELGVES